VCSPTDWIEASCAVVMVGLTGLTLAVLRAYAADTKKIAKLTAEQIESGQRPFLTLEFPEGMNGPREHRDQGSVRNRGKGTALNIEYTIPRATRAAERWPSPLPCDVDIQIPFREIMPPRWQAMNGYVLEYDSLSGRRYRTTLLMDEAYRLETVFEEVEPLSARPTPEFA